MAEIDSGTHAPSDEDLLANAIPVDTSLEEPQTAEEEELALELEDVDENAQIDAHSTKIHKWDQHTHAQTKWNRQPHKTGNGATHVRTFVAKLRLDAIEHLDQQVNEWLDAHPEIEVKFASTTVGILTGKLKEEAIFLSVWV